MTSTHSFTLSKLVLDDFIDLVRLEELMQLFIQRALPLAHSEELKLALTSMRDRGKERRDRLKSIKGKVMNGSTLGTTGDKLLEGLKLDFEEVISEVNQPFSVRDLRMARKLAKISLITFIKYSNLTASLEVLEGRHYASSLQPLANETGEDGERLNSLITDELLPSCPLSDNFTHL